MTYPVVTVEIAFGTEPLTEPGTWTDVTSYVRGVNIRRGRDHELARSQAGEAVIRLDNRDRRFDPSYTSGTYYPNVIPMRQIRVTATHNAVSYPLFYGYIEDYSQIWPGSNKSASGDAECVIHAVDGFKLLSLYQLKNSYLSEVLADQPLGYWPLDDPAGSLEARALAGGRLIPSADATFGITPGPLVGGASVVDFPGTTTQMLIDEDSDAGRKLSMAPGFFGRTFEFWINPDSFPASGRIIRVDNTAGSGGYTELHMTGTTGVLQAETSSSGGTTTGFTTSAILTAGTWRHVVVVIEEWLLSPVVHWYVNGAFSQNTTGTGSMWPNSAGASDFAIAVGGRDSVEGMDGQLAHVAVYDHMLSPSRIAAHYAATFGSIGAADAGTQMTILLDQMDWPAGLRSIDTGSSQMQSFDVTGSALEHLLRICEDSERGLVQMSTDGKVTFHSRTSMQAITGSHGVSNATFGDGTGEIAMTDLHVRNDDEDLWTRVICTREGGAPQLQEDATALAKYGPRTLDVSTSSLLLDEDAELISRYLLVSNRMWRGRPLSVSFKLDDDVTKNAAILGRDTHHDRVTINRRPPPSGTQTYDAHVEGISYDISPGEPWDANLAVIPDDGVTFVFDECKAAPGTLDGGVTSTVSGTSASITELTDPDYLSPQHPGILLLETGTTTTGRACLLGTSNAVELGAVECFYQGYVYISTLSDGTNTYTVRAGLGDSASAESTDFIGFRYTHGTNSGKWQGVCRANGTETTTDTGVAAAADTWVKLRFRTSIAGDAVQFYVDDVAVGSDINTNIPTGSSRRLTYLPGFIIKSAGTTSRWLLVDRYGYVLGP